MAFEDYIRSEVVADWAEGLITRREAIRRLGLLGVGAMAATVLLAGCSDDAKSPAAASTTTTSAPAASTATSAPPAGLPTEIVTFTGHDSQLRGSHAAAPTPAKGSVL